MNKHIIIQQMTDVVKATMVGNQEDFYNYDRPYIEKAPTFPVIWAVAELHTCMLYVGEFAEKLSTSEVSRYTYMNQKGDVFEGYLQTLHNDKLFEITTEGITSITHEEAREIIQNALNAGVAKAVRQGISFPAHPRLKIKLHNISISELKALIRECEEHNNSSLIDTLRHMRNWEAYGPNDYVDVYWNPNWREFSFALMRNEKCHMNGGIIFHGWPESGYEQNYAVQLVSSYGWSMHT